MQRRGAIVVSNVIEGVAFEHFIASLLEYKLPIILVTQVELQTLPTSNIDIVKLSKGNGRGSLIKAGFNRAIELNYDFVITIDNTPKYFPKDIVKLINLERDNLDSIIIGKREFIGSRPKRSTLRGAISSTMLRVFTGEKILDPLSTLRLYPLSQTSYLESRRSDYDYEQAILLEGVWSGLEIIETPLTPIDIKSYKTRSYLYPSYKIATLYIWAMVARFLLPFASLKVEGKSVKEKIYNIVKTELNSHTTPLKGAFAISLGVFMGIFPIHGFQVVMLMFLATRFRLNRPIAFLGVNVSAPPFIPFLIVGAVKLGSLLYPIDTTLIETSIPTGGRVLVAFIIGSIIIAPIMATLSFILSYPVFKHISKNR